MLADLLSLPFFFLTQIKTENEIKTKVVQSCATANSTATYRFLSQFHFDALEN